jgi:histidinol-phosphate/aromatic aminotransferase/cobyric acid decarboxylase-like protein
MITQVPPKSNTIEQIRYASPVRLTSRTLDQIDSPIGVTHALLDQRRGTRPLLDLAQAAPAYPAAPAVIEHVVAVARDRARRGVPAHERPARLREAFAEELSRDYRGHVGPEHVLVTAGGNQAFCLVTSALAEPGDEVILALPYYFNHDMWLRLDGVRPVYLEPGPDLVPTAAAAAELITPRTRAIVLVTPGNPTGVTVGPTVIAEFAALAASRGIALVLDEAYRSFRGIDEPAHGLFADPQWTDTVVSLHSFSKDLAIPGYRVGAVVAAPALLREAAKLLDCLAICAPRSRPGGGLGRAGPRRRLAAGAGAGTGPQAGPLRGRDGGPAGRLRAARGRRVLRLGAPPVPWPPDRGRGARARDRVRRADDPGHRVRARRPRHDPGQLQQRRRGRPDRLRRPAGRPPAHQLPSRYGARRCARPVRPPRRSPARR